MVHLQGANEIGVGDGAARLTGHPMDIAQGRLQVAMAEQALELVDRQPGLQLMGRVGVA